MSGITNAHLMMCISAKLEAIVEALEKRGITTKDAIEKREVEIIKEQLLELKQKDILRRN